MNTPWSEEEEGKNCKGYQSTGQAVKTIRESADSHPLNVGVCVVLVQVFIVQRMQRVVMEGQMVYGIV